MLRSFFVETYVFSWTSTAVAGGTTTMVDVAIMIDSRCGMSLALSFFMKSLHSVYKSPQIC